MLIQFTPKQIAKQWNDLWPLIREGLPLSYMREGEGTGILAGLLRGELQLFGLIEEGKAFSIEETSALLVMALQGDKFAELPLYYIYSYKEIKDYSEELAKELAGGLLKAAGQIGARCLVCHCDLGLLSKHLPKGETFEWVVYEVKEK